MRFNEDRECDVDHTTLGDSNAKALSGTEDVGSAVSEVRAWNPANDHRE